MRQRESEREIERKRVSETERETERMRERDRERKRVVPSWQKVIVKEMAQWLHLIGTGRTNHGGF